MSIRIVDDKSQVPWRIEVIPCAPLWMIEHPQSLPVDYPSYLCENCRCYDFGWLLFHDLDQTYAELRKENRRLMKMRVVRVQQKSTKAGLNKKSRALEAKKDAEEYAKKIGTTYTEVQNSAEMFDDIERMFNREDYGNGISSWNSIRGEADRNALAPHQVVYSYDRGFGIIITTSNPEGSTSANSEADIRDTLQFAHSALQDEYREKWTWQLKPYGFTNLWGLSEDLYLDSNKQRNTGKGKVTLSLCSVKDLLANRNCAFCRLVVKSFCIKHNVDVGDINPDLDLEGLSALEVAEIEAVDPKHGCFITTSDKGRGFKLRQFEINVSLHPGRMIKNCSKLVDTIHLQDIREMGTPHTGRTICQQVDFRTIEKWMQGCSEFTTPYKSHGELMLIDVTLRCIVRTSHHQRYFALSYVWGSSTALRCIKSNLNQLCKAYSLDNYQSQIPRSSMMQCIFCPMLESDTSGSTPCVSYKMMKTLSMIKSPG